jgi:hypothetical protein
MSRWSEWFARRTPEETLPPPRPAASAVNAVAALLAELPEPWVVLRSRRPWYSDGPPWVNFIALHPKKGIALIDAAPAQPEDAVEALEEFLARTRFAAFEQGGPPVVALTIARGEGDDLVERLEIAFTHAGRCRMGNGQWASAVADLLLTTPELMLRRLERVKPEAEEAFDAAEVARFTPPPRASAPAAAPSAAATAPGFNRAERRRQQRAERKASKGSAPAKAADAAAAGAGARNATTDVSSHAETVQTQNNSAEETFLAEPAPSESHPSTVKSAEIPAVDPTAGQEPQLVARLGRASDDGANDELHEPTLTIPPRPRNRLGDAEAGPSSGDSGAAMAESSASWLHPTIEAGNRPFGSEPPRKTTNIPPPGYGSSSGQKRWLTAAGVAAVALLSIGYVRVAGIPDWRPLAAPQPSTSAPATAALTPTAPAETAAPAGTEAPTTTAAAAASDAKVPEAKAPDLDVKDGDKTVEQAQTQPSPPPAAGAPQPPAVASAAPDSTVSEQGEKPVAANPAPGDAVHGNAAPADATPKSSPHSADIAATQPTQTAPEPAPPTPASPNAPPAAQSSPPTKFAATRPADARLPGDTRNPNPDATQPAAPARAGQSAPDTGPTRNIATAAGPRPFIAPRPPRSRERPNPEASSAPPPSQPQTPSAPRGFASAPPAAPAFQASPPPSNNFASNPPPLPRAEPGMPIPLVSPGGNGGGRSLADRGSNGQRFDQAAAMPPGGREAAGAASPQTVTIDGLTYVDGMQPRSLGTLPVSPQQGGIDAPYAAAPQNLAPQPVSAAPGTSYVPLTDARDSGTRRAMPLPRGVIMLPNGQMMVPQAGQ